jgi:hypothetical protein
MAFKLVLGVAVDLQEVGPSKTRAVQGQPAGTRAQSQNCARVPATVASTARGCPPRDGILIERRLNSPFFSLCVWQDVCSVEREGARGCQ